MRAMHVDRAMSIATASPCRRGKSDARGLHLQVWGEAVAEVNQSVQLSLPKVGLQLLQHELDRSVDDHAWEVTLQQMSADDQR